MADPTTRVVAVHRNRAVQAMGIAGWGVMALVGLALVTEGDTPWFGLLVLAAAGVGVRRAWRSGTLVLLDHEVRLIGFYRSWVHPYGFIRSVDVASGSVTLVSGPRQFLEIRTDDGPQPFKDLNCRPSRSGQETIVEAARDALLARVDSSR